MPITKAVIPAAGLGTRFLPATKVVPKELLPIVDTPLIQHIVQEAVDSGIHEVVFVTGKGKGAIEDHFDVSYELETILEKNGRRDLLQIIQQIGKMIEVVSVRQKRPSGLGHAVLSASPLIGQEHFAVLLGDDLVDADPPCLKQMLEIHHREGSPVVAVQRVTQREISRFGIIDAEPIGEGLYSVRDMVEKPSPTKAPSDLAIIGRYILPPEIFSILRQTRPDRGNEIQLTDALAELCKTTSVLAFEFKGKRYDAGDKLGFLQAGIAYALKRPDLAPALLDFMEETLVAVRNGGRSDQT
jgi:UTP--glucose-1-phosphate uridylyltransferase